MLLSFMLVLKLKTVWVRVRFNVKVNVRNKKRVIFRVCATVTIRIMV